MAIKVIFCIISGVNCRVNFQNWMSQQTISHWCWTFTQTLQNITFSSKIIFPAYLAVIAGIARGGGAQGAMPPIDWRVKKNMGLV